MKKAILYLEDGTSFLGKALSTTGDSAGEVVFNTSITGYQEILTDPSYAGQIVTMTYPLIGNYGVNKEDVESKKVHVKGFVVKEFCRVHSNFRATQSLIDYLDENKIIAIEGIDTRALTRRLRVRGAMKGIISTEDFDPKSLSKKLEKIPSMEGSDWVKEVTADEKYIWRDSDQCSVTGGQNKDHNDKTLTTQRSSTRAKREVDDRLLSTKFKVAAIDCGIKFNILRILTKLGCEVHVFPANATYEEINKINPDGIFVSNGPGDPAAVSYVSDIIKQFFGKVPVFGICLGHQLIGMALGGKTYKLKFGHHGANHPVKDLLDNRIGITSQNHGFCVDIDTLDKNEIEMIDINLNDKTLEGIRHKSMPILSFQHHPEAAPGPHDAQYLFSYFIDMMEKNSDQ